MVQNRIKWGIGMAQNRIKWGVGMVQNRIKWGIGMAQNRIKWGVGMVQNRIKWGKGMVQNRIKWGIGMAQNRIKCLSQCLRQRDCKIFATFEVYDTCNNTLPVTLSIYLYILLIGLNHIQHYQDKIQHQS